MGKYTLDMEKYKSLARQAAAEGCVLLKNDNNTLPLKASDNVALFGRSLFNYYKSGLGSGGLVNTRYVVSILDALQEETDITLNEAVLNIYEAWIKNHPYDEGQGWGQVPWSQKEMPLSEAVVSEAAKISDIALVIIGRTAGEDQDARNEAGSYLLTDEEKTMIRLVSCQFKRTAVLLNVGNIIDMQWVDECQPSAVMYVWQGGQEGGHGVADVLTGRVNPCGALTDTIAHTIEDYPSTPNFGSLTRNFYKEDIYVGYRYFETFAKGRVLYPFGYGLSYTTFDTIARLSDVGTDTVTVSVTVTNTGSVAGKEIVQVYIQAPQGRLGKPARVLVAFVKTDIIQAGDIYKTTINIPFYRFASYDDGGATGHKSCYVLEEGNYSIFVGRNVRQAKCSGAFELKETVIEQCHEACAPVIMYTRMRPGDAASNLDSDAPYALTTEAVPLRTVNPYERLKKNRPETPAYTGDKGIKLDDVYEGRASMESFTAQLSDEDLVHIFHGEGMCSPKVTPGTGAAFGGITENLKSFGIPAACCSDGPSGIRMDCGTFAFSLPNGTLLGCTYNEALIGELYAMLGLELRKNRIDALLGPGMNIHRNPLNGRNFEYVSEDPLVTGLITAAQLNGMNKSGSTATIKHFCGNNQETKRHEVDSVISERALREIYLKGFEIAVKEGHVRSVMTTYGPVNGIWTAGNYDLVTTILRNEWHFDGIVMTDWWAKGNVEGQPGSETVHAPMVAAQNDLYMVCKDATDLSQDDVYEALRDGRITRGELVRNTKNILNFILKSPAILHQLGKISQEELDEMKAAEDDVDAAALMYFTANDNNTVDIDVNKLHVARGKSDVCAVTFKSFGYYAVEFELSSDLEELAQLPISVYLDNQLKQTISIQGTKGRIVTETVDIGVIFGDNHYIKLFYGANGIQIKKLTLKKTKDIEGLPF